MVWLVVLRQKQMVHRQQEWLGPVEPPARQAQLPAEPILQQCRREPVESQAPVAQHAVGPLAFHIRQTPVAPHKSDK
jgi:hypothetical protein